MDAKSAVSPLDLPEITEANDLSCTNAFSARAEAAAEKDPKKKAALIEKAAEVAKAGEVKRPKLLRKALAKYPDSPAVFEACYALLRIPTDKPTPEEALTWGATLANTARAYGPRLQAETSIRLAELLS